MTDSILKHIQGTISKREYSSHDPDLAADEKERHPVQVRPGVHIYLTGPSFFRVQADTSRRYSKPFSCSCCSRRRAHCAPKPTESIPSATVLSTNLSVTRQRLGG